MNIIKLLSSSVLKFHSETISIFVDLTYEWPNVIPYLNISIFNHLQRGLIVLIYIPTLSFENILLKSCPFYSGTLVYNFICFLYIITGKCNSIIVIISISTKALYLMAIFALMNIIINLVMVWVFKITHCSA